MRKMIIITAVLLLLSAVLLCYLYIFSADKKFSLVFFNVGQGDAALVNFEDGTKMLVDCGPDRSVLGKLGKYLPFYDRTIDFLIISHPDNDHYGGCVDVLKRYQVKNIIENSEQKTDEYWRIWRAQAESEKARLMVISQPEVFDIGGAKLEFMAPDPSLILDLSSDSANNHSLVFRLIKKTAIVLFTGDMEEMLEQALIKKYCSGDCPSLSADILKIGHHGSDTSSSEEFINSVNPETAIISVGPNRFGHPSLRVLKKLERAGVKILRTDEQGDIVNNFGVGVDNLIELW